MRTLVVLAAALLSSSALAQQVQLPPPGQLPVAATGVPADAGFPQQAPVQQDAYPAQPGIVPVAVPGPGPLPQAPSPVQNAVLPNPLGQPQPQVQPGFGEPQTAPVQPGAAGNPAQQRIEALRAKVEEKLTALDSAAPILSGSQLKQMQQRQMRIRETLMMGQEAKALAEVMKVLDDISGEGSKSAAVSEEEQKRKVEEAVQQALAAKKLEEENAPKPLVASIHGSAGALRAVVLVPYAGQFTVRSGSQLPEGMRVVSVTDNGVVVVKDGKRFPLAFGTVVPGVRPGTTVAGAGGQGAVGRTVQMPIGSSPLPMGGFGSR